MQPAEAGTPSLIVGIGASAGATRALGRFFRQVPEDSTLAFVLALPEAQEQNLTDLLHDFARTEICEVEDQTRVRSNCAYVIPQGTSLRIENGVLHLEPEDTAGGRPIDHFFRALAHDQRENAVGIVLSGHGDDGALGLKAIKEHGGLTFAQSTQEAEFDAMPQHAIATGRVDVVAPVKEIAERLLAYADALRRIHLAPDNEPMPEDEEDVLQRIFTQLRAQTGHDFSGYKRSTVLRRIERRMQIHRVGDLPGYLQVMRGNPEEIQTLFRDLLIGVTRFFRDPDAFALLAEKALPELLAQHEDGEALRVWVPGCSTGEEAYSVAMLLVEHVAHARRPIKIQVFATDIDEEALVYARRGHYPRSVASDISEERLQRFFLPDATGYVVNEELRDLVLFARHNLLKDPPFSRLDLITCRNVLIYFQRDVHERVYELFHYALRADGFLFLGTSESAEQAAHLFGPVDEKHRLFRRRNGARTLPTLPGRDARPLPLEPLPVSLGEVRPQIGPETLNQQLLLRSRRLAGVLINEQREIVHLLGEARRYMQFNEGTPTHNLLRILHPDLRVEVQTALHQALQDNRPVVVERAPFTVDEETRYATVTVQPIDAAENRHGIAHLTFEEAATPQAPALPAEEEDDERSAALRTELTRTKQLLHATLEASERSNAELRASNVELRSVNEELQSASEELETSKEELQSLNEELQTLNQELQTKIVELSRANSDLENLMAATQIATLFLDREGMVDRYTAPATRLFNLIPTDLGRPFTHITHHLHYPVLHSDVAHVFETQQAVQREVRADNGAWFLARLLPYRTGDDAFDGLVLTFVDISERKQAEEALRRSEEMNRRAVQDAPTPIMVHTEDGEIVKTNWAWRDLSGYAAHEIPNVAAWIEKAFGDHAEEMKAHYKRLYDIDRRIREGNFTIHTKSGESRIWAFSSSPLGTDAQGRRLIISMATDVTEQEQAEHDLEAARAFLEATIDALSAHIAVLDEQGTIIATNAAWRRFSEENHGKAATTDVGVNYLSVCVGDEDTASEVRERLEALLRGETERFSLVYPCPSPDESRWFVLRASRFENDGQVRVVVAHENITDRVLAERAHAETAERYRTLFNSMDEGFCVLEMIFDDEDRPVDYRFVEANPAFEKHTGLVQAVGKTARTLIPDLEAHWFEIYGKVARTGESVRFVNGSEPMGRWFDVYAFRVGGEDSRKVALLFNDVTERRQAELALRASEERYRTIFRSASVSLWEEDFSEVKAAIDRLKAEGVRDFRRYFAEHPEFVQDAIRKVRIIDVNDETLRLLGAEDRSVLLGSLDRIFISDTTPVFVEELVTIAEERQAMVAETVLKTLKGERVHVLLTITFPPPDAAFDRVILSLTDMTARVRAEQAQAEAAARLRAVVDTAVDGIITIDEHGHIETVNPAVTRIFGYEPEELVGRNVSMLMPEPYHSEHDAYIANYLRTGERKIIGLGREVMGKRKDGSVFPLDLAVSETPLYDRRLFTGIVRDVTERKQAEEALRESEARFREVAETIEEVFYISNRDGIQYISPAYEQIWGQAREVLYTNLRSFLDAIYEAHRPHVLAALERQQAGYATEVTYRIRRPDGTDRWIRDRAFPVLDDEDHVLRIIGIAEDITAQKKAEDALRELNEELEQRVADRTAELRETVEELRASEARFATTFHSAPVAATLTRLRDGLFVDVNESFTRVTGYTAGEVVEQTTSQDALQIRHMTREEMERLMIEEGGYRNRELQIRRKDGEWRDILASTRLVAIGEEPHVVGMFYDITERKQAEAALQQSEERFAKAFYHSPVGVAIIRLRDQVYLDLNDRCAEMAGYTREELIGRTTSELDSSTESPERREALQEEFITTGRLRDVQSALRTKSGDIRTVLYSAELMEMSGEACALVTLIDITERIAAETALRRSEARFATIFQSAPVAASLTRLDDGRYVDVNEAYTRTMGYERDEILGHTVNELGLTKQPVDREWLAHVMIESGGFQDQEGQFRRKDGTWIDILASARVIEVSGIPHILSMFHDITDRKRLEREVIEISTYEQQRIGQDLHDNLGQQLTAISFMLHSLRQRVKEKAEQEAQDLDRVIHLVTQSIDQTRDISRTLLPFDLEREGFEQALRNLVSRIENRFNIPVRLTFEAPPLRDAELSMHLYRIAQEAANNAVKHAQPGGIEILCRHANGLLLLQVTDDGRGIPTEMLQGHRGLGLNIMRYRARMVGGDLRIAPGERCGTTVTCTAPLPEK